MGAELNQVRARAQLVVSITRSSLVKTAFTAGGLCITAASKTRTGALLLQTQQVKRVEQLVLGNRPTHSVAKVPAGLDGARQTHSPTGIGLSQPRTEKTGRATACFRDDGPPAARAGTHRDSSSKRRVLAMQG